VSRNRELLVEFFNTTATMKIGLKKFYTYQLGLQLQHATGLIELLERTYNLK
jgi:hypothetical protein